MILALITVIQCEDCPATRILQHHVEYEQMEETWHDGILYQFCPTCRHRPQAEDRIADDQAFGNRLARIGREVETDGYVN